MDRIMHRIISGYAWWTTSKDIETKKVGGESFFENNRKARPKYNLPSCKWRSPVHTCILVVNYYVYQDWEVT